MLKLKARTAMTTATKSGPYPSRSVTKGTNAANKYAMLNDNSANPIIICLGVLSNKMK